MQVANFAFVNRGDGAFEMTCQELSTYFEQDAPRAAVFVLKVNIVLVPHPDQPLPENDLEVQRVELQFVHEIIEVPG